MLSLSNPRSYRTSFTYNFANQVSQVSRPDQTSENLYPVQSQGLIQPGSGIGTSSNPAPGQLVSLIGAEYDDPRGNAWVYTLDGRGQGEISSVLDPSNHTVVYFRNSGGCPTDGN
jgi:hypothetical protein